MRTVIQIKLNAVALTTGMMTVVLETLLSGCFAVLCIHFTISLAG